MEKLAIKAKRYDLTEVEPAAQEGYNSVTMAIYFCIASSGGIAPNFCHACLATCHKRKYFNWSTVGPLTHTNHYSLLYSKRNKRNKLSSKYCRQSERVSLQLYPSNRYANKNSVGSNFI